ncbi:phasin family protein [Brevundimonas aveniformis]|uniref:phasin family protein n=1 Tax=Brevundimonas aveniformis TaxID=370977 RepID=UPI00040EEFA1|nr:TIGR01841 family phasin [Brevundimonas aveniformis]
MAAADTVKKSVEQATAAGNQAFKEGVDKSLNALTEANTLGKKNIEAAVESVTAATRGAEALSAQALAFSKKSWEDGVNAAQALASAKSVQEVIELQTAYAKTAMEAYLAEVTKATDTLSASVKDSFKPINERTTAIVERIQSAR